MELKDDRGLKFLVQSLGNTWRGERWCGWFNTMDGDSYEKIDKPKE